MATWDGPPKTSASEPNYSKAISPEELSKITTPLKFYLKQVVGFVILAQVCYYLPSWRWKWRQRKLFYNHVVGRTIDLVPNVGEERWQKLYLDFSRASIVELVGRRMTSDSFGGSGDAEEDDRPRAPNPLRKTKSYGYQMQQEQLREAELAKGNKEEAQEVSYELVEEACMPDTQLGISDIRFRPADIKKLDKSVYDTAVLFNCLCWEDPAVAGQRMKLAWSCIKPGGVLLVIDYGRPHYKPLQQLADWIESFERTSLRLTMDYEKFAKETFDDAEWPPIDYKRYLLGFRYTMVVRKKLQTSATTCGEEKETMKKKVKK